MTKFDLQLTEKAIVLRLELEKATLRLKKYQDKCKHTRTHAEHKFVEDAPDPGDRMYWDDVTCLHCGKMWSTKVTH